MVRNLRAHTTNVNNKTPKAFTSMMVAVYAL